MSSGLLLNVGCGSDPLPDYLSHFDEFRTDINPDLDVDLVANMTNLGDIGSFDVVFCSHALEHLSGSEVPVALEEFSRVLSSGGRVLLRTPDLEGVLPTREVLFVSLAGPITGMDLINGFGEATEENPYMKHKTGFSRDSLDKLLINAGFKKVTVMRLPCHELMGIGVK